MVWSGNTLGIVSEEPLATAASWAWGSGDPSLVALGLGDSLLQHVSLEKKSKPPYLSWPSPQ